MKESLLKEQRILAVDDEPDVLALLEDEIMEACPNCTFEKAESYEKAVELMVSWTYDIVILDIMGVRGFDLLDLALDRHLPVVMLTAHALSPQALKRSIEKGARAYLPKEKLGEMVPFLEDLLRYESLPGWKRLFERMGDFFNHRFGPNWQKDDEQFWKDFNRKTQNSEPKKSAGRAQGVQGEAMKESILNGKSILAVDDEPDVLAVLEEEISGACPNCFFDQALTYEKAKELLRSYTYDLVILDIMGVRGFDLLQEARTRKFPVVMLTAHALSPEALKQAIEMGARAYLPKEKMGEIVPFLEDALSHEYLPGWKRLFGQLGDYFNKRFGAGWQNKEERFWKEFNDRIQ